jgi:hypothetical protein
MNKQRVGPRRRPTVLLFRLSDLPNAEAKARRSGVSDRVAARPFYVIDASFRKLYERGVEKSSALPPETILPKPEDNRGYAFLDDLMQELAFSAGMRAVLRERRDGFEWYAGWHNDATLGSERMQMTSPSTSASITERMCRRLSRSSASSTSCSIWVTVTPMIRGCISSDRARMRSPRCRWCARG